MNEFSSITQNNKEKNSHLCADISTKAFDHCLVDLHYLYSSLGVKNSKLLQIYSDRDVLSDYGNEVKKIVKSKTNTYITYY